MLPAFLAECAARGFTPDAAQIAAAQRLQGLHDELVAFKHKRRTRLHKLLANPSVPRGVYLWGGVGRGKSLLMERFFAELPYKRKRRVHFHAFMHDVHRQLKLFKSEADPLAGVAQHIARQTRVLCFDEFHVSDIADAMILGRLYAALTERGVVFCMTSNYPPDGLYPHGLQRQNFMPTIALLKQELDVIEIDGGIDYRLLTLARTECYLSPA
ncbi:MAG: cell division protein ZapE, partial [Sterolibacterium sp.]